MLVLQNALKKDFAIVKIEKVQQEAKCRNYQEFESVNKLLRKVECWILI